MSDELKDQARQWVKEAKEESKIWDEFFVDSDDMSVARDIMLWLIARVLLWAGVGYLIWG